MYIYIFRCRTDANRIDKAFFGGEEGSDTAGNALSTCQKVKRKTCTGGRPGGVGHSLRWVTGSEGVVCRVTVKFVSKDKSYCRSAVKLRF